MEVLRPNMLIVTRGHDGASGGVQCGKDTTENKVKAQDSMVDGVGQRQAHGSNGGLATVVTGFRWVFCKEEVHTGKVMVGKMDSEDSPSWRNRTVKAGNRRWRR